jgi:hypothetical protein
LGPVHVVAVADADADADVACFVGNYYSITVQSSLLFHLSQHVPAGAEYSRQRTETRVQST